MDQIRFHKADGGGQVEQLKLSRGQYDTNSMYVPDIQQTYVDRDPKNNHYWYAPGGSISVYMNLTEKPFNDVALRRALVCAFDRDQIAQKAELGYVKPASQTGLVIPGQQAWLPSGIANEGKFGFDLAKADSMLKAAGYAKDAQGRRLGKDSKQISFTFKVPGAWTDWVAASRSSSRT